MPRSGGSTELTYVDMEKRPPQQAPSASRRAASDDSSEAGGCLALFLELRRGGRFEVRIARRLRQRGRRRRLTLGLGIARRLRGLTRRGACESRPLLLQVHAQPGELPLDLANRLLALVEPFALGLGEGELLHGLALPLLGLGDLARELVRAIGPCRCRRPGLASPPLPAGDVAAQLLELSFARGDALRVLAQRSLHVLDLRERLLVAATHVQPFAHTGSVSSIAAGGN